VRPSAPVPPPLPKRGAGRPPKGRLVLGTPATRELRELERAEGKAELRELLQAYKGNRTALLTRLAAVFRAPKGKLTPEQLDALLARHGLTAEAEALELDNLRFLFAHARGDLSAVAKRLKLTPEALQQSLTERGLWAEAERLRDRYRRELFGRPLAELVNTLLLRGKYLRELGAAEALERHVREEVERHWPAAASAPASERAKKLAARLAVPESAARELIHRFRLGR
jgi:hypothetical protein